MSIFTATAILFGLRFFALGLNFKTIFGGAYRVAISNEAIYSFLLYFVLIAIVLVLQKNYKHLSEPLKARFFIFYGFCYGILALLNHKILNKNYYYLLLVEKVKFAQLSDMIISDLFFDPPFVGFSLLWMLLLFIVSRKHSLDNIIVILWSLPFVALTISGANLTLIFMTSSLLAGIAGYYSFKQKFSNRWFQFQGVVFAAVLGVLYFSEPFTSKPMVIATAILVLFIWLACYAMIRACNKFKSPGSYFLSWLIPVFFALITSQLIPLTYTHFWFVCSYLVFAGNGVFVAMANLFIMAAIVGLFFPKLSRPVFNLLFIPLIVLFLSDAIAFYMTGLRISRHTLLWIQSYLSSLLKIADNMIEWQFFLLLLIIPAFFIALTRHLNNNQQNYNKPLSALFVFIILSVPASTIAYHSMKFMQRPMLLDAYRFFLASLPSPDFLKPDIPNVTEMLAGLEKIGSKSQNDFQMPKESSKKMNLVLIMLESVNCRYLSLFGHDENTMPRLEKFKNRMELFPLFFSNYPESSNADLALMNGLFPPAYIYLLNKLEYRSETMVSALKKAGYHCTLFVSEFITNSGLTAFYRSQNYDLIFGSNNIPGISPENMWAWGIKEDVMVTKISEYLASKTDFASQPFFLYYRTTFPHVPFDSVTDQYLEFSTADMAQGSYVGRFKNCLLYLDDQLARLIEAIDDMPFKENTIIAIVADHGSMLGEAEYGKAVGHGATLAPEITNVPFIIIYPEEKGMKINSTIGSLTDLRTTLLKLINCPDDSPSFNQGKDLLGKKSDAPIFLSSLYQRALIENDRYYWYPYAEDLAAAEILTISVDGAKASFTELPVTEKQELTSKHEQLIQFFKLQNTLMTHIESYNAELKKLSTESE